jgi:hypothetical protein
MVNFFRWFDDWASRSQVYLSEEVIQFTVTGSPRVGYELYSPISGTPKPLKRANALSSSAGGSALAHLKDDEG